MIFVTVGSQKFQFNRLLIAIDKLIEEKKITDVVFAQTGYSDYQPKHYQFARFLNKDDYLNYINKASIIICHGGTGAIINAIKQGKKVIAIPRQEKYHEHVDDHQLQIVSQFQKLNLISTCTNCIKLDETLKFAEHHSYANYVSNTEQIIDSIDLFIKEEFLL